MALASLTALEPAERSAVRRTRSANDDELAMIFMCCQPTLPPITRVALTLQLVGGFSAKEIAACHATAASDSGPDWHRIPAAYDDLVQLRPSPVTLLNRAVAAAMDYFSVTLDTPVTEPERRHIRQRLDECRRR